MTSIKKDLNTGKYYFVLDAGKDPFSGKRNQYRRRGFETKKEAKIALAKLQVQISEEKEVSISKLHFHKYLEQWFNAKKIKLKPSTIQNYEQQIRYNIVPYIGDVRMNEFNELIIQTYIQTLHKERKLSPATIRAAYGIVAEVLYKASQKGILNKSMLDDISLPRMPKKLRVWTADEIMLFLDAPQRVLNLTRHFIGFNISAQTGMRMGEVLGLRWSDIDFEGKRIFIRQTLSKIDEDSVYGFIDEGKTNAALRVVYVPDALLSSLKAHREGILREREVLADEYLQYDLVVCTKNGNWVHPNNFRRAFKVTVQQLGLPKIRLHDLRHTHATFLLANKVNPKIIQERLGHKNVTVTLNTYSHVLPSMQLEAAGTFDELFKSSDHSGDQ
ncbi:site-specific integrase [Domibacillus indicus]|uniref:site-specific integrase n=1 Tax=Domibacillus indicus TaxID=1437523 RepID=UPI002040980B|nr:site-specific integrase [Domibacillus indicus]MCM3789120.1 site-specific integrase [Domibacillus indicus]